MKSLRQPPIVGSLLLLTVVAGCTKQEETAEPEPLAEQANPLFVDPASQDFSDNPALLERILASPHGYLRFINIPFSQEVCRRGGRLLDGVPYFNLHGDAHVEQYAVTDLGRGLTDFDDSSKGPAIVDILRLAVSLRLASEINGWGDEADGIFGRFLDGYRAALEDPTIEPPPPALATRLMADFRYDREEYFEWVESIVEPVPADEAARLVEAMQDPYIGTMLELHPELDSRYFEIVDVGYLRLGIGSALDRKYLVRIRGPEAIDTDDIVLELKQVRDLSAIECISVAEGTDAMRILIGQSLIAYQPYSLLGYVLFDNLSFWIHAWVDNYAEADVLESFRTPDELGEVAYDIGVQLGRGHPNQVAPHLDLQFREAVLRKLERDEAIIIEMSRELIREVREAWEAFRAAQ